MKLSIIIVSYNVKNLVLECLGSIDATCGDIEYEAIVVDNNSKDGTVEAIRSQYPHVRLIANKENVGFAQANNQGYATSCGQYLLLLNPDTIVKPGAVETVMNFMEITPDCGIAGCRLVNTDGSLQKSIKRFPSPMNNFLIACCFDRIIHSTEWGISYYANKPFKVDYVSGAFMMIKRKALGKEPYLLNPDFYMYSEEKDLSLRLREKGWYCYYMPGAEIVHHGGQSTVQVSQEMFLEMQRSQVKFFYTHHRGRYARLLDLTWWLVVISAWVKSLPMYLVTGRKQKAAMIWRAVKEYPRLERSWRR